VELTWGTDSTSVRFPLQGSISPGGIFMTYDRLALITISIASILALYYTVYRTDFGQALRAIAQDEEKAQAIGINRDRMSLVTFLIGSGLAGVAGGIVASVYSASPFMGLDPILIAFILIVIAGMGSIIGVIIAGYGIGIVENLVAGYVGQEFSLLAAFVILYFFLLLRPHGLFGSPEDV